MFLTLQVVMMLRRPAVYDGTLLSMCVVKGY
uniref:Uncharacterized protein n=1 Tax=Rhizophora mucronata TaxID=61149 RepID=A0A2P2QKN3_RHIMU